MSPGTLPFGRRGLLLGALLLAAVHLLWAAPVYLGQGVPVTKDLVLSYQPMHATLARQAWPPFRVWEPRGGFGFPMLAESQASQLYPPSVLARLLLDPDLGIFHLLFVHLLLTGLFMLALARELRLPLPAACVAALAWMGCGFMVSHLDIPPMLFQAVWLPAAAAALLRHFRTRRLLPLAAAAAALGCMLLAGHFQVALYSFLFLLAWSWFVPEPAAGGVSPPRALAAFALVASLSLALSWAQVKPTLDFLLHSNRAELGGGTWLSWLPLQLPALVQPFLFGVAVRPTLVGSVPSGLATYWGAGVYWETALYVGLVPLVLAISAWPRSRRERFLWAACGLVLVLAAGRYVPWHGVLWRLPLWGSFRFPARLLFLAEFCLALLAGYGCARLGQLDRAALGRLCRRFLLAALAFFLALAAAWAMAGRLAAAGSPKAASAVHTLAPSSGPNLRLLSLVLLVACVLGAALRWQWVRSRLPWLLVAVAAVDLTLYFRAQQLLAPPGFYTRPLATHGGCDPAEPERRYYSVARFNADPLDHQLDLLPASLNLRTACASADYRGSLFDARYSRYAQALLDAYADPEGRLFERPLRLGLFALGGVHQLVRRQPASGEGLQLVDERGGRRVYALARSVPALRRAVRVRHVRDGEQAWQAVTAPGFDGLDDLVIEGAAGEAGAGEAVAPGTVRVLSRTASRLEVVTRGSGTAWLVWSQTWSPRWRASVDGKQAPLLRANYLFQAVAVPAGESRVRLEYSEPALGQGALSAALALGLFVAFAWRDKRRGRVAAAAAASVEIGRS